MIDIIFQFSTDETKDGRGSDSDSSFIKNVAGECNITQPINKTKRLENKLEIFENLLHQYSSRVQELESLRADEQRETGRILGIFIK